MSLMRAHSFDWRELGMMVVVFAVVGFVSYGLLSAQTPETTADTSTMSVSEPPTEPVAAAEPDTGSMGQPGDPTAEFSGQYPPLSSSEGQMTAADGQDNTAGGGMPPAGLEPSGENGQQPGAPPAIKEAGPTSAAKETSAATGSTPAANQTIYEKASQTKLASQTTKAAIATMLLIVLILTPLLVL